MLFPIHSLRYSLSRIVSGSRVAFIRRVSSSGSASTSEASKHDDSNIEDENAELQSVDYRPGSDSYAYDNPWPKLNKGKLDWLFGDGWRRPLAADQGAKMRREWISYEQHPYDEHKDWLNWHKKCFILVTCSVMWFTCAIIFLKPDWSDSREWAKREAHFEMVRRQQAGLPFISKDLIDPEKVAAQLPTDQELIGFDVII